MSDTDSKDGRHVAPGRVGSSAHGIRRDEGGTVPAGPQSPRRPKGSRIERIARRAHEIYEARGGEHGKALDDWLQAEREIDAEDDQSAQSAH
jgi:hypothetical protein